MCSHIVNDIVCLISVGRWRELSLYLYIVSIYVLYLYAIDASMLSFVSCDFTELMFVLIGYFLEGV